MQRTLKNASDIRLLRISRELFLAAVGLDLLEIDTWTLDRFLGLLDEESILAGQELWDRGERPNFLYFMQQARILLTRPDAPPWRFQGRWVLGGFEAHLERPLTRGAIAEGDFHAVKIRTGAWLELLEDSPTLARGALAQAARSVGRLERRMPDAARKTIATAALPSREPDLVSLLSFLAELEPFQAARVQSLADLAGACRELTFPRGSSLLEPSIRPETVFVILEGLVEGTSEESNSPRLFRRGDVVCDESALAGELGWHARALSEVRALTFSLNTWLDLMDEHFDLTRSAMGALGLRRERLLDELAARSNGIVLT
jgi:CRP-like cAMP-binding protein